MAFDYTTPTNVFNYGSSKGTSVDPINEAAEMQRVVTGMSRAIDQYCSQVFFTQAYSNQVMRALVDVEGVLTCWPPVPTMSAPTVAEYRRGRSSSWIALSTALLDVEQRTFGCVVRTLDQDFSAWRGQRLQMRLSYTGGYADLASLPSDFTLAMDALCWWAYQKRVAPTDPTVTEFGQLVVPGNWPPHIKGMFRNYVQQIPM